MCEQSAQPMDKDTVVGRTEGVITICHREVDNRLYQVSILLRRFLRLQKTGKKAPAPGLTIVDCRLKSKVFREVRNPSQAQDYTGRDVIVCFSIINHQSNCGVNRQSSIVNPLTPLHHTRQVAADICRIRAANLWRKRNPSVRRCLVLNGRIER